MAGNSGEDHAIFGAGSGNDADLDVATILPDDDSSLAEPRSAEDTAVSEAIRQISRGVPLPTAPQLRQQPANDPGAQPQGGEPEDRTTAGILRNLLDERDKRQGLEKQVERYRQQETERTRAAEAARTPLGERLFVDPDTTIEEIRASITQPLEQRFEQMRVNHDFALAGVRHKEVFPDAWAAWYQRVGDPAKPDPDTYFRIMKAPSPGEALVSWFKETTQREAVGDDLDAYNAKIIREHYESQGMPVPPQFAAPGGAQPQAPAAPSAQRDPSTGRFAPSQPQAQRFPTATSRMGQSGGGLVDSDDDGSDAAIFDSGRKRG